MKSAEQLAQAREFGDGRSFERTGKLRWKHLLTVFVAARQQSIPNNIP